MVLVIKMPYIIIEKYVKSRLLSNNIKKIHLTSKFINLLKNCQIITWSKKILKFINDEDGIVEKKSCLNVNRDENFYNFNEDNKNDNNYQYDDYVNNYHKYKKISKSFHYNKRRVNF